MHRLLPLFLLLSLSSLALAATSVQTLQQRFRGLDSFSADFVQKLFDADQNLQETSKGILRIQRPNKFNLEYKEPYYQLYVADGINLNMYDKDLEQVTIKPQQGLLDNSPAMILSNPDKLSDSYKVVAQGKEDKLFWYELIPRDEGGSFERIALGFDGKTLRVMEMHDSFGQTTRLEFSNIRKNPDLDPGLFRFVPPKGVDVIRE